MGTQTGGRRRRKFAFFATWAISGPDESWAEIHVETGRNGLDSLALGLRYAEIEALRRKHFEALLTATQRVKLDVLKEIIRLRPTVEESRTANLLGRRCIETYYLSGMIGPPVNPGLFHIFYGDCPDRRALEELPQ